MLNSLGLSPTLKISENPYADLLVDDILTVHLYTLNERQRNDRPPPNQRYGRFVCGGLGPPQVYRIDTENKRHAFNALIV